MAKILAAEDEALVRILIVDALESAGHSVLEAGDGEEALELVRRNPDLDALVTDVRMPKLDGFGLALAARRLKPDIPVLFMTGYTDTGVPSSLSACKVLVKPFDPNLIVSELGAMMRGEGKRDA
jgi:CheY-like chemotaxis protein